jgi:hypothetical protein
MAKLGMFPTKNIPWSTLPVKYMEEGLRRYVERGIMPGSFLTCLLSNNMTAALAQADKDNRAKFAEWIEWIGKHLPEECWGAPEKVYAWSEAKMKPHDRALQAVEANIAHTEAVLEDQRKERERLLGETEIVCEGNVHGKGCGAVHKIKDLTYIATHWYVRPYSCTGGDYWNEGEGNFICPSCNHRNRMFDREHYQRLKRHFGRVVDEHKDR